MSSVTRQSLQPYVQGFRQKHRGEYTVFVMMRFATTLIHATLFETIRDELQKLGLCAVRADEENLAPELWTNVQACLLGADAGIVIFDNVSVRGQPPLGINPNVSVELGYLMGLDKPWLMLKDKYLETMPVDLGGIIYRPFDGSNPGPDVRKAVRTWAEGLQSAT
jgi:hypothetical protein